MNSSPKFPGKFVRNPGGSGYTKVIVEYVLSQMRNLTWGEISEGKPVLLLYYFKSMICPRARLWRCYSYVLVEQMDAERTRR